MLAGSERGAVVGFVAGLLTDLFLQTPMGLSALTYSVVGFGSARCTPACSAPRGGSARSPPWSPARSAWSLFVVIGAVVGVAHLFRPGLTLIVIGVAVINGPLSIAVSPG